MPLFGRTKTKEITPSAGEVRPDGGVETNIDLPGLATRIAEAARYVVSTVRPNSWMSPNQPMQPAVPETAGRAWDYPVGLNLQIPPRATENITFQQLRDMAEPSQGGLDLLRLLIETRKDQIHKIKWAVRAIDPDQDIEGDERIAELQKLFRMPDGVNTWHKWLSSIIEEMLVTDAVTIYPRMTRGGELYALEQMDGATIKRVIGEDGRMPLPPDPAYQQVLKGVITSDYTSEQLIYYPRVIRINKLYGFSPVEQVITTINLAIRRQAHQLQYYVNGNLPDLLLSMPKEMSQEGVERFMRIWEARLNGNLAARRQAMPIPEGTKPYDLKENALKDEMDEWVARVICFAFSISPQPFIKMVNRGNQESMQEAALQEGLLPIMQWIKDLMDAIIWKYKGYLDLEFGWEEEEEVDPDIKSKIQDREIRNGKISIDEARLDDGREPVGMPNAVITATGPIMLKPFIDGEVDGTPQPAQVVGPDGKPQPQAVAANKPKPKEGESKPKDEPAKVLAQLVLTKRAKVKHAVAANRPVVRAAAKRIAIAVRYALKRQAQDAISRLSVAKLAKDDDARKKIADAAIAEMAFSWGESGESIQDELELVYSDASQEAAAALIGEDGVSPIIEKLNDGAKQWAQERAAEMVGKKWVDGELVDNPDPKWAISESTRSMLRETIASSFDEGMTPDELGKAIKDSYAFSSERADMIASTEAKLANNNGSMNGFKETGLELQKMWLLSNDHEIDDECDDNADDGWIPLDDEFSSGDDVPPNHPKCECSYTVQTIDDTSDNEDEEA